MNRLPILALLMLSCNMDPADVGITPDNPDQAAQPQPDQGAGMDGPVARRRELRGGSRLKAKIITGEDGSEAAVGLFDTMLGVDCAFSVAEDGRQRCLPTEHAGTNILYASPLIGAGEAENLFADAACTRRIAVSRTCSPPVKYARFTETCGGRARYAAVSETTRPPTIYFLSDGKCNPINANIVGSYRYYAVGALMAPSDFVAGNLTME